MILTAMLLALAGSIFAQDKSGNYITFDFGTGLQSLLYKIDGFENKLGAGVKVGLGYKRLFNDHIGLLAGVQFANYNRSANAAFVQSIDNAIDEDGNNYTHRTSFNNLKERQKSGQIMIPVEFVYVTSLGEKFKFQADGGFYAGFSVGSSFRTVDGNLDTRRYYYEQDLVVDGDYPQHSLYTANEFSGSYDLKASFGGLMSLRLLYPVDDKFTLTAGFYGMMSFTSVITKSNNILYDPDCMSIDAYSDTHYNGVLNSALAVKVKPFGVGMMVGFEYGF